MSANTANRPPVAERPTADPPAVHAHLRGSMLLVLGRILAKAMNCLGQVLLVWMLSRGAYGELAYALSIVALAANIATLGLHRAMGRFLPVDHAERRYDRLLATVAMALGLTALAGLLVVAGVCLLGPSMIGQPRVSALLMLLVLLAPLEALDELLLGVLAAMARPGAIFWRKHLLGPGLKLTAVGLVFLGGGNAFDVAIGYLAAAAAGLGVCAWSVWRILRAELAPAWSDVRWPSTGLPWREVLGFSFPLFCSELLFASLAAVDVIVLQRFSSMEQVAALGAAYPLAAMNQLVLGGFLALYVPAAARIFARRDRRDRREMNSLYWQTAVWIAVLTSPILLLTFAAAKPLTLLLYGSRYADTVAVLSLLSLAWYLDAALGFNKLTLQVYGRFKFVLAANAATLVLHLVGVLLLVPSYGACGAAAATCLSLAVHNAMNQYALWRATGVALFERRYAPVYAAIALTAAGLWLIVWILAPPALVSFSLAAAASAIVLRASARRLAPGQIFPVLDRIPARRWILGW